MKMRRPGQRIFKTSIAVFLSFIFSHFRSSNSLPFYSAIAAIVCTKSDVHGSIDKGVNRIFGTLIGGIIGFLYLYFLRDYIENDLVNYLVISLILFFLIWFMSVLDKPNAISIMAIVFCSISINHVGEDFGAIEFALNRTLDTLVGVVIAIFVNSIDFEIKKYIYFKKNKGE